MELLIVGTLDGQIGAASKIAISQGGKVSLADKIETALEILRSGTKNIELVMIDVRLDIHKFISSLTSERINGGCGLGGRLGGSLRAFAPGGSFLGSHERTPTC